MPCLEKHCVFAASEILKSIDDKVDPYVVKMLSFYMPLNFLLLNILGAMIFMPIHAMLGSRIIRFPMGKVCGALLESLSNKIS